MFIFMLLLMGTASSSNCASLHSGLRQVKSIMPCYVAVVVMIFLHLHLTSLVGLMISAFFFWIFLVLVSWLASVLVFGAGGRLAFSACNFCFFLQAVASDGLKWLWVWSRQA